MPLEIAQVTNIAQAIRLTDDVQLEKRKTRGALLVGFIMGSLWTDLAVYIFERVLHK